MYIYVIATSQDYVWAQNAFWDQLVCPATTMTAPNPKVTSWADGDIYGAVFYCDQWSDLWYNEDNDFYYYMSDFVLSSSNPSVVSIVGVEGLESENYYEVWFYPQKRGSANLTIRTTDGTNKSCSINVTVK